MHPAPASGPPVNYRTRIFPEKRVFCKTRRPASARQPGALSRRTTPGTARRSRRIPVTYSISSKMRNIGRYIAMMMPPTMPPTTTIISGSIIEVSALTVASTSDS